MSSDPRAHIVPVTRERLKVGRRRIEVARVIVKTKTEVDPVVVDELLRADDVRVERVPIGRLLDEPVMPHYEGDVLVIPVLEEVPVVSVRLRLVEEVRVHRNVLERRHRETVPVRRQHVEIERRPVRGASAKKSRRNS